MSRSRPKTLQLAMLVAGCLVLPACGTTRWTDTGRTGTEQLLISDAIDRAVSEIDFHPLAGKKIYLDSQFLKGSIDEPYLVSSLRQQMLSSGCVIKDDKDLADYVVEARAGSVGTDRHDLLFGVPQTNIGAAVPMPGVPQQIPEIPLAKRTVQKGVAKLAVFAYHRESGRPAWQSGIVHVKSDAANTWVLGIGPFQRGTIYPSTSFAGNAIQYPRIGNDEVEEKQVSQLPVARESYYEDALLDPAAHEAEVTPPSVELPADSTTQPPTRPRGDASNPQQPPAATDRPPHRAAGDSGPWPYELPD